MRAWYIGILILLFSLFGGSAIAGEMLHVGAKIKGDETVLMTNRYGVSDEVTITNGYLFVDREYIPSPYHVRRMGQAVVVNGILLSIPFTEKPETTAEANRDWRSPMYGFKSDTPKVMAEAQMRRLADHLLQGGAWLISESEYADKMRTRRKAANISMRVPIMGKWSSDTVRRVLDVVTEKQPMEKKRISLRQMNLEGLFSDDALSDFITKAERSASILAARGAGQ